MGLLRDFVDRLRQGTFPGWREPDAVQELFAACVKRDLGAKAVFLTGQDGLGRHGAVVEEPLQPGQLDIHEAPQCRGDFNVSAGEFESHLASL